MNKHLLRIMGMAFLVLLLHVPGFSQQSDDMNDASTRSKDVDEIIIRHKNDKDAKVTIEIKDGQVLVNGKPASDFDDSTLAVSRRKVRVRNGGRGVSINSSDGEVFIAPGDGDFGGGAMTLAPMSRFRNNGSFYSYGGSNSNRAFLGVSSEDPASGKGARLIEVNKGSAAEKMGLKTGDVITKVDEVTVSDPESLTSAVRKHKPGEKVTITYSREGKEMKATGELGKAEVSGSYSYNFKDLPDLKEFSPNRMAPRAFAWSLDNSPKLGLRAQDTEDGKGVKVLDVDDESAAEKAGIKEGDVITRFDGKDINSATALAEAARAAKEKMSVHISLLRSGKPMEIDVKVPRKLKTADL